MRAGRPVKLDKFQTETLPSSGFGWWRWCGTGHVADRALWQGILGLSDDRFAPGTRFEPALLAALLVVAGNVEGDLRTPSADEYDRPYRPDPPILRREAHQPDERSEIADHDRKYGHVTSQYVDATP